MVRPGVSHAAVPWTQPPLVGRAADIVELYRQLDEAGAGRGGTVVLVGEGGIGKTRLAEAVVEEATRRGFRVAAGRAFQVESGVPYALFSDAFAPIVRALEPATLSNLVRGGLSELAHVLPGVAGVGERAREPDDPVELKTRVLWTTAELVRGLAAKKPLLIVLDDVHWADLSSLELLHFLARQTAECGVLMLCTYNETERGRRPELRTLEQSLLTLRVARLHRVEPLTFDETAEVVRRTFGVDDITSRDFSALLYGWTRGNVFFLTETLRSLVESGRLHRRRDGQWLGWELAELELPPTVREVVAARLERLHPNARRVADAAAVIGNRFEHELLRAVVGISDGDLLAALDELRILNIVREIDGDDSIRYDFVHPMLRQSLYTELGAARTRALHAAVADVLERRYGAAAEDHADELAVHFARAGSGDHSTKAVRYLLAAGLSALGRYADREAVEYLRLALDRWRPDDDVPRHVVMNELARAHQRTGDHDAAIALWNACLESAQRAAVPEAVAVLHRRLGQALYWSGRHEHALAHFMAGSVMVEAAGRHVDEARLRLAAGVCLQELGRADEAQHEIERALRIAEEAGDVGLLARVHRALLLLHIWIGPPDAAREHGARAVTLARDAGDAGTEFYSEWGLAVLEGLTGHTDAMKRHIANAERLAELRRSPLYWLWTAELSIELASATGDWDRAVATGERAIALARSLNQRTLWPRLLVWTSLIHMGRGDLERAKAYVDEAWTIAGADAQDGTIDVHTVVPAHIGVAAYHMTRRDFKEAIRVCEEGLAIADRTGYTFWAMHRLLPIMAESYCHLWDVDGAAATEARIRREAERLGHKVGLAWADTCRALVSWLQGDLVLAAKLIRAACASLEAIPVIPDAARLRRQLAGRLAEIGDREGALNELRQVHDIFTRLGAEDELAKARGMFRELNAKPPARTATSGAEGLTGREVEIARMVADRKSNKAIGKALDISPRTVSTHLSNIFRKLEVNSRGELADYVKEHGLQA